MGIIPIEKSQSLLNEVKYSNILFKEEKMNEVEKSQSLLNEVKYSNGRLCNLLIYNNFLGHFS